MRPQRTRLRHVTESPPTLSALGLTKRESAEAQLLAALTAAEWAKRKNMCEEAIQHCRSYALEAERKMG